MRKIYRIPENIMKGSKVFNGTIELRNFVEGCILVLLGLFACRFIPVRPDNKISLYILICAPLFLIGIKGIQGDPVSSFVRCFIHWMRNKKPYLRNPHGLAYDKRSSDLMFEDTEWRKALGDFIKSLKKKYTKKKKFIEGKTFRFAEDPEWSYLRDRTNLPKDAPVQEQPNGTAPIATLDLSDLINAQYDTED